MKCSEEQVEQLSEEPILQIQSVVLAKEFFDQTSIGIAHNGTAIVLLGPSDDNDSIGTCCRLINCPQFKFLIEKSLGQGPLSRIIIENEVLENRAYPIISTKTSQSILAILTADFNQSSAIAALCCIQTPIVRCFVPSAESLSLLIKPSQAMEEDQA